MASKDSQEATQNQNELLAFLNDQEPLPFQDEAIELNDFFKKIGIETYMTIVDVALIFIFCICFPSVDIFTDVYFASTLLQPKCYKPGSALTYGLKYGYVLNGNQKI